MALMRLLGIELSTTTWKVPSISWCHAHAVCCMELSASGSNSILVSNVLFCPTEDKHSQSNYLRITWVDTPFRTLNLNVYELV